MEIFAKIKTNISNTKKRKWTKLIQKHILLYYGNYKRNMPIFSKIR